MKFPLLIVVMSLVPLTHLRAQATPPPGAFTLVGPPVSKRAPDFACWTITTSRAESPAAKPVHVNPKTKKGSAKDEEKPSSAGSNPVAPGPASTITKTPHIVHVERTDEQNQTWNIWITAGHELSLAPNGDTVAEVAPPSNPDMDNPLYTDFSRTDFPGFEWLSVKNFTGVEDVGGRACLTFRDSGQDAAAPPGAAPATPAATPGTARYAAVDYYSRLPAVLAVSGVMQEYHFKSPPSAALVLPEKIAQSLRELASDKKATDRAPSKPY